MSVLTFGTFDTPHMGHAIFLGRCAVYGEVTVALRSDAMVEALKGAAPAFTWRERKALIERLGYRVWKSDEPGRALIDRYPPTLLAVGSDWLDRDVLARYDVSPGFLRERGVTLMFIPYTDGISTTEIRKRLV